MTTARSGSSAPRPKSPGSEPSSPATSATPRATARLATSWRATSCAGGSMRRASATTSSSPPPFRGGVDWQSVDPAHYSHLVFVCGPFPRAPILEAILARFARCRRIGVNFSMSAPPAEWNPFDVLIERDSGSAVPPELAFGAHQRRVPLVGVCLREPAPGTRTADAAIARLVDSAEMAVRRHRYPARHAVPRPEPRRTAQCSRGGGSDRARRRLGYDPAAWPRVGAQDAWASMSTDTGGSGSSDPGAPAGRPG